MSAGGIPTPTVEAVREAWLRGRYFAGPSEKHDAEAEIDAFLAPLRPPVVTLHTRWASVNQREWPATGQYRHVVRRGHHTSLCGTTALPATLWRAAPKKPACPECTRRLEAKP